VSRREPFQPNLGPSANPPEHKNAGAVVSSGPVPQVERPRQVAATAHDFAWWVVDLRATAEKLNLLAATIPGATPPPEPEPEQASRIATGGAGPAAGGLRSASRNEKTGPAIFDRIAKEEFHRNIMRHDSLTDRELRAAALVALGLSNKEIAVQMNISEQGVKAHLKAITRKGRMSNRTQIALWYHGLPYSKV
jgi:DNA-binding CsgD family transcriptional regulator